MTDIINIAFSFPTVVPLFLLVVCSGILLFSLVIGGFDSVEAPTEIGGFENPLITAGLSKVPTMIGLTLTFLPMTILTFLIDSFALSYLEQVLDVFGIIGNVVFYVISVVVLIGLFYISLYIAKFLSIPLEKAIDNTTFEVDFVGRTGIVNSLKIDKDYGEIRVQTEHGDNLLDARTIDGSEPKMNDEILICEYDEENKVYLVKLIN